MVVQTFSEGAHGTTVFELSPDGAIHRHEPDDGWPLLNAILPDGSLIVEQDLQLVRLIPPA
jgi:hypothetical protein